MSFNWDTYKPQQRRGDKMERPPLRLGNFKLPGALIFIGLIAVWLLTGFYIVGPDEQGIVLRFGRLDRVTTSGLNYRFPFPIESVYTPKVTEVKRLEIGFRTVDPGPPARYQDRTRESRMLTGDENIVDVDFIVQYRIADAAKFLFNVRNAETTMGHAAEAAIRQVVGSKPIDEALTTGKGVIQQETMKEIQRILDKYGSGLRVVAVQLQDVNPPKEVIGAFKDVASAREDKNRMINEAQGYQNQIIPETRGRVAQILFQAEAYRETKIRQARGDADRFLAMLKEYKKAPKITRKRLYLEMMQDVMPTVDKIILDDKSGSNVLPILSLEGAAESEVNKR